MIWLIYLVAGIVLAFVGAIPLGTVNLSVVYTTINQNKGNAMKIAYTAGIAEIILALLALHFGMLLVDFISGNLWIQATISAILFIVAFVLLRRKPAAIDYEKSTARHKGYWSGFVLGLLNPPVLIYWVFVIGMLKGTQISLQSLDSLSLITIFLSGVYIGKLATLYLYSEMSTFLKNRITNAVFYINKAIGFILLVIVAIQLYKLLIP